MTEWARGFFPALFHVPRYQILTHGKAECLKNYFRRGYNSRRITAIGYVRIPKQKIGGADMRKFLIEMEQEITLDELRRDYYEVFERGETGAETFERYLELCMWWNNGALTEILTADTPRGWASRAVGKFCVEDAETGEKNWEWLPLSQFDLFAAMEI
jgi:hypothetical protein